MEDTVELLRKPKVISADREPELDREYSDGVGDHQSKFKSDPYEIRGRFR